MTIFEYKIYLADNEQNIIFCMTDELDQTITTLKHYSATDFRKKLEKYIKLVASNLASSGIYGIQSELKRGMHITAFKFKSKTFNNARIYCQDHQQTQDKRRRIILCEMLESKKQTKQTHIEKNIIERIAGISYD